MVRNSETLLMVLGIRFCTERSMAQDVVRNLAWLAESLGDRG